MNNEINKKRENPPRIIQAFCFWCDLLGYGAPFMDSNWDLTDERSMKNLDRVKDLQHMFTDYSMYPIEKILVMNDGFIRNVDLVDTLGQPQRYIYWLNQILLNFNFINNIDKQNGYPGARAVLTYGHRYEYMKSNVTAAEIVLTSEEKSKELAKNIMVYSPKEFQMNTAFSKAYIMESYGKRAGLEGAYVFIDDDFLFHIENLLTKDADSHYLLAANDMWIEESGQHLNNGKLPVSFQVKKGHDEEYFCWEVMVLIDEESDTLFKMFFEKDIIEFDHKGISTKLRKLVMFRPFDEEENFDME